MKKLIIILVALLQYCYALSQSVIHNGMDDPDKDVVYRARPSNSAPRSSVDNPRGAYYVKVKGSEIEGKFTETIDKIIYSQKFVEIYHNSKVTYIPFAVLSEEQKNTIQSMQETHEKELLSLQEAQKKNLLSLQEEIDRLKQKLKKE